jgi:glycosyltransferase involved in cell wall biosynthesis
MKPQRAFMIEHYAHRLRRRLRAMIKSPDEFPVLFNVNEADESNHAKRALFIWRYTPFVIPDDDPEFLRHQNLRQCRQIAALLGELGYIVDVADVKDKKFRLSGDYNLIISTKFDSKYMGTAFRTDGIIIFLALTISNMVHNINLRRRHELLYERRRFRVMFRKLTTEKLSGVQKSHAIVCFGNEFVIRTWKEIFKVPTYHLNNYGFNWTACPVNSKDFALARRNFLFFASRCQIQKGLDLALEVFRRHTDLHLYVGSYFEMELDFCSCYYEELFETSNIHPMGWITVNGPEYNELAEKCAYVILPSCSEGQAGSVVQCMYSGLIPLVTKEVGIDTEDFGITFSNDTPEEIERVIVDVSQRPESWHREQSIRTRRIAEEKYSEAAFVNRWREILAEILNGRT